MLVTNIIIVNNITQEATHVKDFQAIANIGELCYLLSRLALITRQFQLSRTNEYVDFDTLKNFQVLIDNALIQQNNLLIDYSSWSDCKGSDAIKDNVIPYVTYSSPYVVQYTNLYTFTYEVISNVINIQSQLLLDQLKNGTLNVNPYYFFIIFNVMGESYNKLNEIYADLETCELNRLNSLNTLKINLLIAGIVILCVTFSSLGIYLVFIDYHLNLIWELLRIRARNSFFELKENIESRLAQIHEKDEISEYEIDSSILKHKEPLKFRHSLRTIARFSIIFIIAVLFILLQSFLLENNLQTSLRYHPTLTADVMNRKALTVRITYYVLEARHSGIKLDSLSLSFPYYNTITVPQVNVYTIHNQLNALIDKLRFISFQQIFSQELQTYTYYSYPSNSSFLITGTLNAMKYFNDESLNYVGNMVSAVDTSIYIYYNESQILYNAINITTLMEISDLKYLIDNQLNNLYYFTGAFGGLFLLIYLFYYYPMLTFEINFLRKLTDIIQMIPRNSNNTMSKTSSQTKARFSSMLNSI